MWKMPSVVALAAVAGTLAAGTGCPSFARIEVSAAGRGAIRGRIDEHWFQCVLFDDDGSVNSVELLYCPLQPGVVMTCRRGVVCFSDVSPANVRASNRWGSSIPSRCVRRSKAAFSSAMVNPITGSSKRTSRIRLDRPGGGCEVSSENPSRVTQG